MAGLTLKQQKFADEYIISGNATEAYKKAYPNVKKDATAAQAGSRLLRNVKVSEFIREQTESLRSSKIMDQQEVMERYTAIARGEPKKAVYREKVTTGEEVVEVTKEYEHSPSFEDVNKALEQIGKRYAMWTDKQDITADVGLELIVDYGDEE